MTDEDQQELWRRAWIAGFNEGIGIALMRLETANDETPRICIADSIRKLEIVEQENLAERRR